MAHLFTPSTSTERTVAQAQSRRNQERYSDSWAFSHDSGTHGCGIPSSSEEEILALYAAWG